MLKYWPFGTILLRGGTAGALMKKAKKAVETPC
jgi:hypothetical protein